MTSCAAPLVVLIAAVARNGVIGKGNRMLWRIAEDMAFFKRTTTGHAVIMGHKTWLSLPERFRPLPDRRNIVLSRDPAAEVHGASLAQSLPVALALCMDEPLVFVIGGAQVYEQALPLAQRLLLTEIDADFDGDAYFPHWGREDFDEIWGTDHRSENGLVYRHVCFQRKQSAQAA